MHLKRLALSIFMLCIALIAVACSPALNVEKTPPDNPIEIESDTVQSATNLSNKSRADLVCVDKELLCIALVTGVGKVNDQSFNQAAWEAVKRTEIDLLAQVDFLETETRDDVDKNIEHFANQGYDVIVTVGASMTVATKKAAKKYASIHFIGVDQDQFENTANTTNLVFPEKKMGFMAGVIAAKITQKGTVGIILPEKLSGSSADIQLGFESGIKAVSSNVEVMLMYHPSHALDSLTDPDWGADAAGQMLDAGADVIFSGGGPTGNGALIETASNRDVYCIGIGSDQWLKVPEAQSCLVTSVTKQISNSVFDVLARIALGQSTTQSSSGGDFVGQFGLAPYREFESQLPADIREDIEELLHMVAADEIPLDGSFVYSGE